MVMCGPFLLTNTFFNNDFNVLHIHIDCIIIRSLITCLIAYGLLIDMLQHHSHSLDCHQLGMSSTTTLGVAERAHRLLQECITAMLNESGLPSAFWEEALAALVHVWN
ncbi:hypothetical protein L210DRAFT_3645169 [Boletus edulis BED1]|uniref:Uncharacterized protein n=1 Tax=Boletus edulis BED1 TaxID=1328754 RepID=A0AAD4GEV2_BOLED|nr:hypothetical protein L210DRAFT_3645169 [Boletus edulis BED1]